MREELVSNIYNVTQISSSNNTPWDKMMDVVNESEEPIEFDFDGIELEEPWLNDSFKKLMRDDRVYLKIYSSTKTRDTIELMLLMNGYKTDRVKNEDIIYTSKFKKVDQQLERMVSRFKENLKKSGNKWSLNICDVVDQIGSTKTIDALEKALMEHSDTTGTKEYDLDIESMFIQDNVMQRLAELIDSLAKSDIYINIRSEDDDTANTIKTFQLVAKTLNIKPEKRVKVIQENVNVNTVGMLSKFKETKSKDLFGRCGEGRPIICRPAIFKGLCKKENTYVAVFQEFRVSTFTTKMNYQLEHDGEKHPGLEIVTTRVPVQQLGLYNIFIGSLYQFSAPVQQSLEDYITDYESEEDDNGETVLKTVKKTLPEHIKSVLDEFNVEYDKANLIHAIVKTKDKLEGMLGSDE